jgi:FkbM family methyltransferase
MQRLWLIGLLVTVPSAVALTVFMPEVINVVLGSEYAPAALPSKILAWSMPLAVIGGPLLAYLISRGRGVQTTAAFAVAGVVSLALHVILDPRFGAVGAAVASLARDAANVAVAGLLVWRAHGLDDVSERERIEPATRQRQQPVDRDPLKGLDRVRLLLARPFLHYLSGTGISRGKGFITRRILPGILPQPPTSFSLVRPGGTRIRLLYGEVLGIAALVHGGFEDAECRRMLELAMPGTVAIDAGANVGIHTIPLASRLAPGMVIAVEPLQGNAERLLANASLNAIVNIDLHVVAAGSSPGLVNLHLASDGAFVSTGQVVEHRAVGSAVKVEQTTLDVLWETAGRPAVSLIKVDVEGEETGVMLGAKRLLSQERPAIVAEASTPEALSKFSLTLAPHGYRRVPAEGFQPWNHLFLAGLDRNEGENAETLAPGATLGET